MQLVHAANIIIVQLGQIIVVLVKPNMNAQIVVMFGTYKDTNMFKPSQTIIETLLLNHNAILDYIHNKDNMIHFLDVIEDDGDGNEIVTKQSYFSMLINDYMRFVLMFRHQASYI